MWVFWRFGISERSIAVVEMFICRYTMHVLPKVAGFGLVFDVLLNNRRTHVIFENAFDLNYTPY